MLKVKQLFPMLVMALALMGSSFGLASFEATDLDGVQAIITAFLVVAVAVNIALTVFFVGKKGSGAARRA